MVEKDSNTLADGSVPTEFWAVPEKFITDEGLRLLHASICTRLRDENPDADTLEIMAIERIASLFFYMRDRERHGGIGSDSAYKSMMSLWVSMAAELRKSRMGLADEGVIREQVMSEVVTATRRAVQGLDPEVAGLVKRRFAEHLGAS